MADSDDEYVADELSDDLADEIIEGSGHGTRSSGRSKGPIRSNKGGGDRESRSNRRRAAWEDVQRSWDIVVEGAEGNVNLIVEAQREADKRQRLLRDTTPLQRGIIRHLILILDLSFAMTEKDLRPTRYLLALRHASAFVTEYFEQNPISQLGIIGMRDGLAIRISDLSGNPVEHLSALTKLRTEDPQGNPSLQNSLEMARAALFNAPSHGTREILIIYGALLSSDPGDVHLTIASLIQDRIRVSVIGLAAEVAILAELCSRTNGEFHVAMHEQHYRDLMMAVTTPPVTRTQKQSHPSLLMMGFPSRTVSRSLTLCACHSELGRGGYLCPRCGSKVCSLPAECPACELTLILSTHLARSYHHLFPLKNWIEVSWEDALTSTASACYACQSSFPKERRLVEQGRDQKNGKRESALKGLSESSRYACQVCGNHFCIDCDVFAHEVAYNCPGCQSDTRASILVQNGIADEDIYGMELEPMAV